MAAHSVSQEVLALTAPLSPLPLGHPAWQMLLFRSQQRLWGEIFPNFPPAVTWHLSQRAPEIAVGVPAASLPSLSPTSATQVGALTLLICLWVSETWLSPSFRTKVAPPPCFDHGGAAWWSPLFPKPPFTPPQSAALLRYHRLSQFDGIICFLGSGRGAGTVTN